MSAYADVCEAMSVDPLALSFFQACIRHTRQRVIYIYIYMYVYMYIMNILICINVYINIFPFSNKVYEVESPTIDIYVYIYIIIYINILIYVYIYVYTYIYTYIHTYIQHTFCVRVYIYVRIQK